MISHYKLSKDLEIYLKKIVIHPVLNKDQILKNFLCLAVEDFKVFQKNHDSLTEKKGSLLNSNLININKLYEYVQAYIKTSFASTLLKNKTYETVEIDILIEKVKKCEEAFKALTTILENLNKVEKNQLQNNGPVFEVHSKGYYMSGIERWSEFVSSENQLFEVLSLK